MEKENISSADEKNEEEKRAKYLGKESITGEEQKKEENIWSAEEKKNKEGKVRKYHREGKGGKHQREGKIVGQTSGRTSMENVA